jgi:hypothetical protein
MTSHEWALVIQGPMVSKPPPQSWLYQALEAHERAGRGTYPVESDCSSSITETVRRARSVVRHVVLSTWSDAADAAAARRLASQLGCDLVLGDDPGPGRWNWGAVPDNRWRQIHSTVRGLERVISATGATHVVRTRTDQIIDVASIAASIEQQEGDSRPQSAGQGDYIYVPGVLDIVPYAIDDFYFAGRVADVWQFFSAQWELRGNYRGVDSVHVDLVMKHVARNLRGTLPRRILPYELFPVVDATRVLSDSGRRISAPGARYLRLWSDILEVSLKPLPRAVYESIIFRGVPYRTPFERMFLEEWLEYRDDIAMFFLSRFPDAFARHEFGALGRLLNYAPECAALDRAGIVGAGARTAHFVRRALSGRYRGVRPEQLT